MLHTLADRAQFIRTESRTSRVMVGLFVFEPAENSDQIDEPEWAWDPRWLVLQALRDAAQNDRRRVIDLVVLGSGTFVKFWENGGDVKSRVDGPVWHQYWLPHLAPAYFLNNFVHHATGHMTGAQQAAI